MKPFEGRGCPEIGTSTFDQCKPPKHPWFICSFVCSFVHLFVCLCLFYGMDSDIFEAMGAFVRPSAPRPESAHMSNSLHVAPGLSQASPMRPTDIFQEDDQQSHPWYDGLQIGRNSSMNHLYWGIASGRLAENKSDIHQRYIQDSVSVDTSE
jgi:hypothetical protein